MTLCPSCPSTLTDFLHSFPHDLEVQLHQRPGVLDALCPPSFSLVSEGASSLWALSILLIPHLSPLQPLTVIWNHHPLPPFSCHRKPLGPSWAVHTFLASLYLAVFFNFEGQCHHTPGPLYRQPYPGLHLDLPCWLSLLLLLSPLHHRKYVIMGHCGCPLLCHWTICFKDKSQPILLV